MCTNEACLGYLLLAIIVFFTVLIIVLIKLSKSMQAKDLKISADQIWKNRPQSLFDKNVLQSNMIFGISTSSEKSATLSQLVVKNGNDEIIGYVDHTWGSRQYLISIGQQKYRVELPLNWSGAVAHLISSEGKVLATYERKSLGPWNHQYSILDIGVLKSNRPIFTLKHSIEYFLDEKFYCMTSQISAYRKMGRVGYFHLDCPLPVKIFILAICL